VTIITEEGRVFLTRYGKRYAIWVRCPECGPTPPRTRVVPHAVSGELMVVLANVSVASVVMECSKCGRESDSRECLIPERTSQHGRCGKKCWNGKYECACICLGKCHSEGKCFCD